MRQKPRRSMNKLIRTLRTMKLRRIIAVNLGIATIVAPRVMKPIKANNAGQAPNNFTCSDLASGLSRSILLYDGDIRSLKRSAGTGIGMTSLMPMGRPALAWACHVRERARLAVQFHAAWMNTRMAMAVTDTLMAFFCTRVNVYASRGASAVRLVSPRTRCQRGIATATPARCLIPGRGRPAQCALFLMGFGALEAC